MRLERLLPYACIAAALMLAASELMVTFEFVPPGGEALAQQDAADRHYYAPLVLALFAIASVVVCVLAASKPAGAGVAAAGAIALLIFLIVDLPDANNVGTLDDPRQSFFSAEAVPQAGFWLELIGSLTLALSGAALASLARDQLEDLRPRWLDRFGARPSPLFDQESGAVGGEPAGEEDGRTRRGRRGSQRAGADYQR